MHEQLKKNILFKYLIIIWRTFFSSYGFKKRLSYLLSFFKDYKIFKKLPPNDNYRLETKDIYPRIYDKIEGHKIDPVYFLQGTWCARKIFEEKPDQHYDIGSQAFMVGIISQFVPTTMIDIRPLSISLSGLSFIKGNIIHLPFKDSEISSLSSICVIEHIGLGRYGDSLDQFGTEKAAKELIRVLAKEGSLYISVPVDNENKIYFNAHRAFTRDYIIKIFENLNLIEEKYIYGNEIFSNYNKERGFGTGMYHFKK